MVGWNFGEESMSVKLVVAVTDKSWFENLCQKTELSEVNFWTPSIKIRFRALKRGELFLFKLHSPDNFIVGGGVFAHENLMPCSMAWEAFGESNGASSFDEMRSQVAKYQQAGQTGQNDFPIGCRILTQPFFLPRDQWIPVPKNWSPRIMNYKTYSTSEPEGLELWEAVSSQIAILHPDDSGPRKPYGEPYLIRPRLGQGAFRSVIIDAYERRCAVTKERTLPALDAAHIRPYREGGKHVESNGLLLRRDIHSLFDSGYVTITPDFEFQVSRKIREEFENGHEYYSLAGERISVPKDSLLKPDRKILEWHNDNRFLG